MINKSSQFSKKPLSMASLMAELPLSPSPINGDSAILPCDSCRPSTVFYSPNRFLETKSYKQYPNCMNNTSSYEVARNMNLGEVKGDEMENSTATYENESSFGVNDGIGQVLYSVPPTICEEGYLDKRGAASAKFEQLREAIPVIDDEQYRHQLNHRSKPYQQFLDETRSHKQKAEVDAMRKATYTHMLRKLTKKEEAIDEWELNCRKKAEFHLDKLERKLEQKRAEAVQKVHKKLAEAKLEAQKRKAKARRSALKEMAKHSSQLT